MSVAYISIEQLLEDYKADALVIRYGDVNREDPYLELKVDKDAAKNKRIEYITKCLSPTGERNYNMVALLGAGVSQKDVAQHYIDIGLTNPDGSWIDRRNAINE